MLLSFTEFYWVLLGFTGFGSPLVLMVDQEEANGGGQSVDGGRHQRRWFVQMMAPQIHQVAHKSRPLIGRQRLLLRRRCCSLVVPVPEKKSRYWSIFLSPVDPRGPPWTPLTWHPRFFLFLWFLFYWSFSFFFLKGRAGIPRRSFTLPVFGPAAGDWPAAEPRADQSATAWSALQIARPSTDVGPLQTPAAYRVFLPSFPTESRVRQSVRTGLLFFECYYRVFIEFTGFDRVGLRLTEFRRVWLNFTQFYPVFNRFT